MDILGFLSGLLNPTGQGGVLTQGSTPAAPPLLSATGTAPGTKMGQGGNLSFGCPSEYTAYGIPVEHIFILGIFVVMVFIGLIGLVAPEAEQAAPLLLA